MSDYTFGTFQFRFDYLMINKISNFSSDPPPYFVNRKSFDDCRRTSALPKKRQSLNRSRKAMLFMPHTESSSTGTVGIMITPVHNLSLVCKWARLLGALKYASNILLVDASPCTLEMLRRYKPSLNILSTL